MNASDEIAATNKQHWEQAVLKGAGCTVPWLDLDVEAFRAFREGQSAELPPPLGDDPINRVVMPQIRGKEVLCLAAGGGQQSAVYALLGARVTVFDLAEGQLAGDRRAAEHYGYQITTIQGDMRRLSALADASFDLVHGLGMAFVPDVCPVYAEVARVLRPGGRYRVSFTNPAVEFLDWDSWDGKGYRLHLPYVVKEERDAGSIQFRHYMREIFNGLLAHGFTIEQVEDSWLDTPDLTAGPGSWHHWAAYIVGFDVLARNG